MNSLIIVNPASGAGNDQERTQKIETEAKSLGWHGQIEETTKTKSADKIVQKHLKKSVKHIIVCGGDGTVMEAVRALVNKRVELSVVPLGTGNIFALNLGISSNTSEALSQALKGSVKNIDVGKANEIFFGVNCGMGFDADMMRMTGRKNKDRLGLLAYIISGIKILPKPRNTFSIKIDDKEEVSVKARSIMVANMEKTAAGIRAVPGANPKSGTLKIGIIKPKYLTGWLNIFINALS